MPKAIFNGTVIAESPTTAVVEGNHYFPVTSVMPGILTRTDLTTHCPWKGQAVYFDLTVNGQTAHSAAWAYPQAYDAAAQIRDKVAFYPVVQVTE